MASKRQVRPRTESSAETIGGAIARITCRRNENRRRPSPDAEVCGVMLAWSAAVSPFILAKLAIFAGRAPPGPSRFVFGSLRRLPGFFRSAVAQPAHQLRQRGALAVHKDAHAIKPGGEPEHGPD